MENDNFWKIAPDSKFRKPIFDFEPDLQVVKHIKNMYKELDKTFLRELVREIVREIVRELDSIEEDTEEEIEEIEEIEDKIKPNFNLNREVIRQLAEIRRELTFLARNLETDEDIKRTRDALISLQDEVDNVVSEYTISCVDDYVFG